MAKGFIKLDRRFTEWGWYKDAYTKALFLHLIFKASFKDSVFMGRTIKRGQVAISIHKLATELECSDTTIKRCLNKLKSTGEIKTRATSKYTLITIVNYDKYQEGKAPNDQPSDQRGDQPSDQRGDQPSDHIRRMYKNVKECKELSSKPSLREKSPKMPILEECVRYAIERGSDKELGTEFYEHYESNGWMVGSNPMRNWKMSLNGWIRRRQKEVDDTEDVEMNIV